MATGKRYYWIKLKESFMTSDAVDFLMGQPDGANYVVLYQMLCLKTINTDGRLSRRIGEVIIPYDEQKIARDTKWFSVDTVRVALNLYKALGLIYQDVDGSLVLTDHANLVGSETDYAERNRRLRANQQPAIPEHNVYSDVSEDVSIAIGESIEAYYKDGTLAFHSYYYARQIFDLSEYYRIASNTDVQAFTGAKLICCSDPEEYIKKADTWERKKIASIMDSGLLVNHSAKTIQKKAGEIGVNIQVEKSQIVLPTDKKQRKILLGFLDEEVYKGAFTNTVYQTNSKKKA